LLQWRRLFNIWWAVLLSVQQTQEAHTTVTARQTASADFSCELF
jgi:hypothetical protein